MWQGGSSYGGGSSGSIIFNNSSSSQIRPNSGFYSSLGNNQSLLRDVSSLQAQTAINISGNNYSLLPKNIVPNNYSLLQKTNNSSTSNIPNNNSLSQRCDYAQKRADGICETCSESGFSGNLAAAESIGRGIACLMAQSEANKFCGKPPLKP
jgi:hypothetical protein